jgi:ubiquinone/menaquinone biosynthesis C-methylase UbiE
MLPMHEVDRSLVLRVNEVFHDIEGARYADQHPEIFDRETLRWKRLLAAQLSKRTNEAMTFVDIGCGTGFVGLLLSPYLRSHDTLVCADISATMLGVCEKNLRDAGVHSRISPLKMEGEHVELPDGIADVITLNSVLHHVPDPSALLKTIERLLKPGGMLLMGHEPNRRFFQDPFLLRQATMLHNAAPKRAAAAVLKTLGLYHKAVSVAADPIVDGVNEVLMREHCIEKPLSKAEMSRLIDAHSPTAGGLRREEGFDPLSLFHAMPSLETITIETYNHLGKVSGKHALLRPYEWLMAAWKPSEGSTFFLVARKRPL